MSKKSMLNRDDPHFSANKALTKMRYMDLQAAVIMRGMDYGDIVEGDHGKLASWFIKNYTNPVVRERLELFDDWVDQKLNERGYKKNNPVRQFRRFSNLDDGEAQVRTRALRRADVPKKKKVKRERDKEFNIFKGTKKDYTYKLSKSLYDSKSSEFTENIAKQLCKKYGDLLVERVQKKFTDAQEKSIKIWMKRCLDGITKKK